MKYSDTAGRYIKNEKWWGYWLFTFRLFLVCPTLAVKTSLIGHFFWLTVEKNPHCVLLEALAITGVKSYLNTPHPQLKKIIYFTHLSCV